MNLQDEFAKHYNMEDVQKRNFFSSASANYSAI